MTDSLETLDTSESVEDILSSSFEEIKQDIEKGYDDKKIISGEDTVQKSIRNQMGIFVKDFPRKLEDNDVEAIKTYTTQTKQALTDRMLRKTKALSEAEGTAMSIKSEGFQRYRDINSLLEKIINVTSWKTEVTQ